MFRKVYTARIMVMDRWCRAVNIASIIGRVRVIYIASIIGRGSGGYVASNEDMEKCEKCRQW
jgi:hypothetical protein